MTLNILLTSEEEARLTAFAVARNRPVEDVAREAVLALLPSAPEPGTSPFVALIESWLEEDRTGDPAQAEQARKEVAEMKRALNANRAATGDRIAFPEMAEGISEDG